MKVIFWLAWMLLAATKASSTLSQAERTSERTSVAKSVSHAVTEARFSFCARTKSSSV